MEQLSPCRFLAERVRDDPTAGKLKLLILFGSTSQDQITSWFSSRALPRNPTGDESSYVDKKKSDVQAVEQPQQNTVLKEKQLWEFCSGMSCAGHQHETGTRFSILPSHECGFSFLQDLLPQSSCQGDHRDLIRFPALPGDFAPCQLPWVGTQQMASTSNTCAGASTS